MLPHINNSEKQSMVLLLDIGNTNIKIGVSDGTKIVRSWRIATDYTKTADEYGMVVLDLLSTINLTFNNIDGIIMSSVAPSLNYTIEHMCKYYTNKKPLSVTTRIKTGIKICYAHPEELGSDRIVNAAAAYALYKTAAIIVDFGSATTFGVIDGNGNFLGGAIAPGIKSTAEGLTNTAAKLPRIELSSPISAIGRTTVENMQSGIIFGFRGLVKGMVERIKQESGIPNIKTIATGGMSEIITIGDNNKLFDITDRALSLKGLQYLYGINK
jgi:type III pantothenate kinase